MLTGKFNQEMKDMFDATDGAYTTFTQAEIEKQTANVKVVIRDLIIENSGDNFIPRWEEGRKSVEFQISPIFPINSYTAIDLVFRNSKPDRNEVSVYFNAIAGVPSHLLKQGNKWFVYYKKGEEIPYIGIIPKNEWYDLFEVEYSSYTEADIEENETDSTIDKKIRELQENHFDNFSLILHDVPDSNIMIKRNSKRISSKVSTKKYKKQRIVNELRGNAGENVVLKAEREKMLSEGHPELVDKVEWVASEHDGLGYDVVSYRIGDSGVPYQIFIEVKTTSQGKYAPFYISNNEIEVSTQLEETYFLYRVYEFNHKKKCAKYYIVNGAISNHFILEPINYKAMLK